MPRQVHAWPSPHAIAPRFALSVFAAATLLLCNAGAAAGSYGTTALHLKLESDARFRGISQNAREVTPELLLAWSGPHGFYSGTRWAKVNWGHNNPSLEWDVYAGKTVEFGGTELNALVYYYGYPEARFASKRASFFETIGTVSRKFGPARLTFTGAWSPAWPLEHGRDWYAATSLTWTLDTWLRGTVTIGREMVERAPDFTHYEAGLAADWRRWSFSVRYLGSTITPHQCAAHWMGTPKACGAAVSASLTYSIADIFG